MMDDGDGAGDDVAQVAVRLVECAHDVFKYARQDPSHKEVILDLLRPCDLEGRW